MELIDLELRGKGKQALSTGLMTGLIDRLKGLKDEPILLFGHEDAFSAGLDLKEIASFDAPAMRTYVKLVETLMERVFDHPGPVVAALNGHAIAGGCVLALCADHRVCTDNPRARVGLNEVPLGLKFPPVIARIVKHRVAPRGVHEVILRGALHAPADALRLGLVDELAADPIAVGRERVRELASAPRRAYASAKHMLRHGVTFLDESAYEEELDATLPAWTSDAIKERVLAHLGGSHKS
jgi:enoyl-CoA hydratase